MKPNDNLNNKMFQQIKQDFQYVYFKDTEGRLKRLRKKQYKPRQGYIRLKLFEKFYLWWKKKSFDYKNAIVPLFLGMSYAYFIYYCSMTWSQNQLQRQIKARLPFSFQNTQIEQMKKIHENDQKQKYKNKYSII